MIDFNQTELQILFEIKRETSFEDIAKKLSVATVTLTNYMQKIYAKTADVINYSGFRKYVKLRDVLQSEDGKKIFPFEEYAKFLKKDLKKDNEEKENVIELKPKKNEDKKYSNRLTKREKEVLFSLIKTVNYSETAKELCLSPTTLKTHTTTIFSKLQVNSFPELVKYFYTKLDKKVEFVEISKLRRKYEVEIFSHKNSIAEIETKIKVLDELEKEFINEKA
jgi:DNA-binding CsgD family transcriptional regulator